VKTAIVNIPSTTKLVLIRIGRRILSGLREASPLSLDGISSLAGRYSLLSSGSGSGGSSGIMTVPRLVVWLGVVGAGSGG